MRKYHIILRAELEYGGTFEAPSLVDATALAKAEMKLHASELVGDIDVERAVFLDPEDPDGNPLPA